MSCAEIQCEQLISPWSTVSEWGIHGDRAGQGSYSAGHHSNRRQRGWLAYQGRAEELLPDDCSIPNETIALMNGHKAFKEIPNCQIEGNAYTTVRANLLTTLERNT